MTLLFVFCFTCNAGMGTLWPPQEIPTAEQCERLKRILVGEPPGPVDIAELTAEELAQFLNDDQERQALSRRLVVKCLPRE